MQSQEPQSGTAERTAETAERTAEIAERSSKTQGSQRTQRVTTDELNRLTEQIIGLSIKVHKALGPGFVERMYEQALAYELERQQIPFVRQKAIKVEYEGVALGTQRVDLLVADHVIVEIKSVSAIHTVHEAQMVSYLKAADKRLGLILNFAKTRLDIKRMVNRL